jgi:hypothetical protein
MDFMYKLVETVLVAGAEVNECLDCLIGVSGDILALREFNDGDGIICKFSEVGDTVVDIGRFVDAD